MALIDRMRQRLQMLRLAFTLKPIAGGAPEGDENGDDKGDKGGKDKPAEADKGKSDKGELEEKPEGKFGEELEATKYEARKHEERAKKAVKRAEEAEAKLNERENEDKSERDKAIDAARVEARKEALEEADKDRKADRLEVAVTRAASKGITVGEGDDAKTKRFDDPEDALVFVERQLASGDLDEDDIFDENGKVKGDAVEEALAKLLERKPRLAADAEVQKPSGDADTRKGDKSDKALESMTPADHERRKYGKDKQ